MRREVPMPVAIGVIVIVLLVVIGAYLLLGRPGGRQADIRMNPHGAGKLITPETDKPPIPQPSQPQPPATPQ
ncbi:hypothetical protein [Fervidibacter sacchari]|jgi:hypothetical protein